MNTVSQDNLRVVFVSHSGEDTWVARQIAQQISLRGARPFLDEADVDVGAEFDGIMRKIRRDAIEAEMSVLESKGLAMDVAERARHGQLREELRQLKEQAKAEQVLAGTLFAVAANRASAANLRKSYRNRV